MKGLKSVFASVKMGLFWLDNALAREISILVDLLIGSSHLVSETHESDLLWLMDRI